MFLKVYQIYFNESQQLEPEYIPYKNENCTVFFENSVIVDLINEGANLNSAYFGVVSYKLREKIGSVMKERWANIPNIANHSVKEFTPDLFETELSKHLPDVMSFQRHLPHDPISVAERFHPGFTKHFKTIMNEIGYDWNPTHFENVFYCNFFVAKSDIYDRYVKDMLKPAMEVMKSRVSVFENSHYPERLPDNLRQKFGISHYPFHPFLCERMFSYFAHLNKLKCLHY